MSKFSKQYTPSFKVPTVAMVFDDPYMTTKLRVELSIDNGSVYVMVNGQSVARFNDHKLAEAYALSVMGF